MWNLLNADANALWLLTQASIRNNLSVRIALLSRSAGRTQSMTPADSRKLHTTYLSRHGTVAECPMLTLILCALLETRDVPLWG